MVSEVEMFCLQPIRFAGQHSQGAVIAMNRAQRAKFLLLSRLGDKVTLREMAEAGVCALYTCRNAAIEAKHLMGDGYTVTHFFSENGIVGENGYICKKILESKSDVGQETKPCGVSTGADQAATSTRLHECQRTGLNERSCGGDSMHCVCGKPNPPAPLFDGEQAVFDYIGERVA